MYTKRAFCFLLFFVTIAVANAQVTYLPLGDPGYHLLDRIETRSGNLSDSLFLVDKPVSRRAAVEFLLNTRPDARYIELSKVDLYNMYHARSVSGEWDLEHDGAIPSKHPVFNTFYRRQPDLVYVNTPGFFLSLNPVLGIQGTYETVNSASQSLLSHTEGLALRSCIADRVGISVTLTNNYEEPVSFVTNRAVQAHALQGVRGENVIATGKYQYIQGEGTLDVALIKDHVNATAGYGRHFIGDGIRSLFLSDYAAPAAYLQLSTRIWKLRYQNLYMQLTPQFIPAMGMQHTHKYATMHHLSVNLTRWLNFGLFEAVVFDRSGHFEIGYMNPIILYRQTERALGSPDKVNLGIDFKAIAAGHLQFYGQFLLNEFTASQFFSHNGYWANKWGLQLGAKYFDAFTLKNLDIQAELNMVRPYTFTHYDSTANFTHYNQPLAHPLGAGFRELIARLHYQPANNLFIDLKAMYYQQGVDTGSANYGSDIFKDYDTRSQDFGVHMINGPKTTCTLLSLNLSYRLRENLFIDLGAVNRNFSYEGDLYPANTSTYFYGGLRLNMARRDYAVY
ncbi:MAG: hypothetical protein BGO69_06890 [Bacteroidetes bacterium 46-16]|nr:MAG: hypothetical protein BGO69_06890 [Bacteroidetes bacterium 46-16]